MNERISDRQPDNEAKIIKGNSLAIHFDAYSELLARIQDRAEKYLSYLSIDKEGDLPFPITQFNLSSYWRYENTDMPDVSGTVSFSAEDTSDAPNAWPYTVLDTVRERLAIAGSYPQQMNYDPLALYIPVDEIRLLRLDFYSGPNECGIEISTIYKEDSHLVLETHGVTKTNPADAVLQAGEILTLLADELCKTYDTQDLEPQRLDPYVLDASLKYLDENSQQAPTGSEVDYSMEAAATPKATLALGERALTTYRYPSTGPSPEELELKGRLTLRQIGGFFKTKQRLEQLANVFDNAEIAARYGVTANNFMLHGPSKVDNDQLIEAFAGSIDAVVIPLRTTDLVDKMIGESAKKT